MHCHSDIKGRGLMLLPPSNWEKVCQVSQRAIKPEKSIPAGFKTYTKIIQIDQLYTHFYVKYQLWEASLVAILKNVRHLSFSPAWLGGSVNKPTITPITRPSQLFFFFPVFSSFLCPRFLCSLLHFLLYPVPAVKSGVCPVVWICLVETCGWQKLNHRLHSSRCVPTDCLDQFLI